MAASLVLGCRVWAAPADPPLSEFVVEVLTPDDGVPPNVVSGFAQGADGFLWMVSDQTVARYDGRRFLDVGADRLGPVDFDRENVYRQVARLFTGGSGAVWMSRTSGDLWRWTGREFEPWLPTNGSARAFARVVEMPTNQVLAVSRSGALFLGSRHQVRPLPIPIRSGRLLPETVHADPDGMIWCMTDRGAVHRFPPQLTAGTSTHGTEVATGGQSLAQDKQGAVWLGTRQGLSVWRANRWEAIPPPAADERFAVRTVVPGHSGVVWVSSQQKAWAWHSGRWTGPVGDWPDQVPAQARTVDQLGRLWLAVPTQGLYCFQPEGGVVQLGPKSGLTADSVALFCDREGTVWVGVYRVGIARVRERRFAPVVVRSGLQTTPLWNLAQDVAGAMWLLPEFQGPVRWENGETKEFTVADEPRGRVFWTKAMAADRSGSVWAAAMGTGVLQFEDGAFRRKLPWPDGAGFSRVLYQDRTNRWWLGSDQGLWCWAEGEWTQWGPTRGLPGAGIRAITEDAAGRLWVGTFGKGLAGLEGERFVLHGRAAGLPHDSIYTLCPGADGSLWIGTHGGLARWRNGRFTRYTTAQGLPDNRVVQVLEDHLGFLWLGTRDGLARVSVASLDAADRGRSSPLGCMVFDLNDGLPTRLFQDRSTPACWRGSDGRLWFLTAGAAVHCRPERIRPVEARLSAVIEEVLWDGQPWAPAAGTPPGSATGDEEVLSALAVRGPSTITLPPGAHWIEIRYTAPSPSWSEDVRFEHKLDGLDARWVRAGAQRSVHYSALTPGTYRFRVRASNGEGAHNHAAAELGIVIEPHFWQTRWFPVLLTLTLVGTTGAGGAWFQRARLRRQLARLELQRAREAERTRISRDLHDHLGANLTEIGMLAADAGEALPDAAPPAPALVAIGQKVQTMIGDLDSIVWAIDPQKDTLPALASYLGSFVSEFSASSGIECRLEIQRDLPAWPMRSETRHNLFLAVKEATHNAVRHGHATRLLFRLALTSGLLEIAIQDNGCGFDLEGTLPGNGLVNLRERLTYLGGRCDLASRPASGTVVQLVLPLRNLDPP